MPNKGSAQLKEKRTIAPELVETLCAIRIFRRENGNAPTLDELASLTKLGKTGARARLVRLEVAGFLSWKPWAHRSIVLTRKGQRFTPHKLKGAA